jgi:hypothetical protein
MSTLEPIDYEAVLADLRSRRDQLNAAISGLEQMLGFVGTGGPGLAGSTAVDASEELPKEVGSDTFFGLSAVEGAKKYLRIVKRPTAMKTIHDALRAGGYLTNSKNFYANLYTAVMRSPEFQKVGKGWGLAEWYQGRRVPVADEATKTKKRKPRHKRRKSAPAKAAKAASAKQHQEKPNPESEG